MKVQGHEDPVGRKGFYKHFRVFTCQRSLKHPQEGAIRTMWVQKRFSFWAARGYMDISRDDKLNSKR